MSKRRPSTRASTAGSRPRSAAAQRRRDRARNVEPYVVDLWGPVRPKSVRVWAVSHREALQRVQSMLGQVASYVVTGPDGYEVPADDLR